ncbi:30S ribosomal protein S10 [Candidatus Microgenomates bacterium]|nr:30S ribosomal protein S10 [Candidatus Microgenomates bacterium]
MPASRIRVKLKSFDHRVIDEAAAKIVEAALSTGASVSGPTPLPTRRKLITVNASPHVDKDAQDHFEILTHKRIVDIMNPTSRTIDSLSNLDLPAGVSIEIKM